MFPLPRLGQISNFHSQLTNHSLLAIPGPESHSLGHPTRAYTSYPVSLSTMPTMRFSVSFVLSFHRDDMFMSSLSSLLHSSVFCSVTTVLNLIKHLPELLIFSAQQKIQFENYMALEISAFNKHLYKYDEPTGKKSQFINHQKSHKLKSYRGWSPTGALIA